MRKYTSFVVCLTLSVLFSTGSLAECFGNDSEGAKKVPVLLYHHLLYDEDIKDKGNAGIISVENFTQQMNYLKDNGYTTLTMEQLYGFLYDQEALPPKSVLITFDDGYYSNYAYAYPILKEYGFKASIFIITSHVSDADRKFFPDALTMLDKKSIEASKRLFRKACSISKST